MSFGKCLYTVLDGRFDLSEVEKLLIIAALMLASAGIAYLLGSINFAIIFSKFFYHDDVRAHGSGNAGATNMLRTYGNSKAALTLICDMLKCAVAIVIGSLLFSIEGADIAGLFCVVGHVFPCWHKFHGGKGVAVTAMVILMTSWPVFLILLAVFAIVVIGTKYVSLASVMASLLYPVLLSSWNALVNESAQHNVLYAFLITVIVVFMHRENIKRILNKTESKISFGKKKDSTDADETEATDDGANKTAAYQRYQNKKNKKRNGK